MVDNVEHLLGCVPLLEDLVAAAPGVRLLATSRFSLRMRGEHEHRLEPLAFADADDAAVELFARCAHAAGADLERRRSRRRARAVRAAGRPAAGHRARGRAPAAASASTTWSPAMSAETALADAGHGRGQPRSAAHHRRHLAAAVATASAHAFARLSRVPRLASTRAAAIAVIGDQPQTMGVLASLFDRSLLRRTRVGRQVRLSLLATLRAYAARPARDESGELAAAARRAHAEHYTAPSYAALLAGEAPAFRAAEAANLRVALDYALDRGRPAPAGRLAPAMRQAWSGSTDSIVALLSGVVRLDLDRI